MSAANVCVFVAEDRFQNRRDPMSHRIIEKRRRDRMNNCLADLSRLIPAIYLKKGRGRIEKTEIIEMAIKHLKHLQAHACKDPATCEVAQRIETDHRHQYRLGFHECMSECVRFMVEIEGMYAGDDLCIRLMNHLQKHFDKVAGHGFCYQVPPPAGMAAQSSPGGTTSSAQLLSQQPQAPPIPVQIHHPPGSAIIPVSAMTASAAAARLGATSSEDVKPIELEPSADSSAFTRRSGGPSFAPRPGGLLQGPHDLAQGQVHHLMVPKQEGPAHCSGGQSECRKLSPIEISRSPQNDSSSSASQLREMLQNPAVSGEKMRKRSYTDTSTISSCSNQDSVQPAKSANITSICTTLNGTPNPNEEVYNFKKNIKERFQSDLRLYVSSPTDSVDEDESNSKGATGHEERRYSHSQVQGPVASPHSPASFSRHTVSAPPIGDTDPSDAGAAAKDLSAPSNQNRSQIKWEQNQMDSNSSAGSPPGSALPRSSGSSSGYSSNGSADVAPRIRACSPPLVQGGNPPSSMVGVPIFALHPKGAFYVPLTLDTALISPIMQSVDDGGDPILHPVSISVNFNLSSLYRKHITPPPHINPWRCVYAPEPRLPLILPSGRV